MMRKRLLTMFTIVLPVVVVASFLAVITTDVSIMNQALQDLQIEFD